MRKWAALCPQNFLHKERLVAGALAQVSGDCHRAERFFLEAQRAAAESGYPHIEALAHRLAADSMREREPVKSERHLRLACDLYRRWGASAYAEALGQWYDRDRVSI